MDKKIFTFLNCLCLSSYALGCGKSRFIRKSRIVGGRDATIGQYPWMISLREKKREGFEHVCGAAIINENWIVTAAHCLNHFRLPEKYEAFSGLIQLSKVDARTVQRITFSKLVVHEGFDSITVENDIALLKTTNPVETDISKDYVASTICLPQKEEDPAGNATVIGWGLTAKDGENSDNLKEVFVPIMGRDACNSTYGYIADTMICAGEENKDACQMDSGGPLFQTNSDEVSTLIGVVSFGHGCGDKDYPGVYTKVSAYLKWMENVMAKQ